MSGGLLLGCIADDFTGATDLASMLVSAGMTAVQSIGVPDAPAQAVDAQAIVIALKSRTIAPSAAVEQSLAALKWLRNQSARQIYFKYCSTFDSTANGNIGPVADALADALGAPLAVVCPALPASGRTIYQGYLMVGNMLLSESPMRDHPLTPMRDSSLVRLMQAQTLRRVGLVPWQVVRRGSADIVDTLTDLRSQGIRYAVTDALDDDDLRAIGKACSQDPLVTGGSGLGAGLAQHLARGGQVASVALPNVAGGTAVLAGSCSAATRGQVEHWLTSRPGVALDPLAGSATAIADQAVRACARWIESRTPFLVYSSAAPEQVRSVQRLLGRDIAARRVEESFAIIAAELVRRGITGLVIAGGETSGAVVEALNVRMLGIGDPIEPGVPWTVSQGEPRIALALKSGNFGSKDFFVRALDRLA